MNRILPLITNPPVIAYQYQAHNLGVLFTNPNYHNYFYRSYINISYDENNSCGFNLIDENDECFDCNYLGYNCDLDIFGYSTESVLDMIKYMINNNYYLRGLINEFYVPNRIAYNKYDHEHDFLIYGYNDEYQYFNIIGYDHDMFYKETVLPFENTYNGLFGLHRGWLNFMKIKNDFEFVFDINVMKGFLSDYIYSDNKYGKKNDELIYGINIYEYFTDSVKQNVFDLRYLRTFLEHKECMYSRIE